MFYIKTQIHNWHVFFIGILILSSCGRHKEFVYFNQIQKDSTTQVTVLPKEPLIQVGDALLIVVADNDELLIRQINGSASAGTSSAASPAASGPTYFVNDSGKIKFPLIGSIFVKGLTKDALSDSIRNKLISMKYLLNPIVNIRIISFKVTVLGEVMRPGVIAVPNEHITLIDAISQSGDLTIFARRDNVLVIREKDGKRIYKRIDLTKNDLFDSEYYYLENKDIVYVEPTKKKAASLDKSSQVFSMVLSSLSLAVLIYTQLLVR
ncbi:MAG: polysaccharide export protein [Bacteroidia bacterium]|nr:polysaccharide export protein [Bacteroidia bacterium]